MGAARKYAVIDPATGKLDRHISAMKRSTARARVSLYRSRLEVDRQSLSGKRRGRAQGERRVEGGAAHDRARPNVVLDKNRSMFL
jgi:hypothetical protein